MMNSEERELFIANLEQGDHFVFSNETTKMIRIIDIVKDGLFQNEKCYIVYAHTHNERRARIISIKKFVSLVEQGLLFKAKEYKYDVGDSFYGINGNMYIIQALSNIYREAEGNRYFATVISTLEFEECEMSVGSVMKKKYEVTEAILKEEYLDSLEKVVRPVDSTFLLDSLAEDEGINPEKQTGRNGYVR